MDNTLGHTANLNKFKRAEIIQNMWNYVLQSKWNLIRNQPQKEIIGKPTDILKLNSTWIKNPWAK